MEHRWSIRKPMYGSVTLTIPPWHKAEAAIEDVSVGGMGIAAGPLHIPLNTVVMLSFTLDNDGCVSHHRLPAQVVHSEGTRTGLLFIDPTRETLHALRGLPDAQDCERPPIRVELRRLA